MDEEKFNKLFTASIPIVTQLADHDRQSRLAERLHIINYLKELLASRSNINLYGAILLLEQNKDKED